MSKRTYLFAIWLDARGGLAGAVSPESSFRSTDYGLKLCRVAA